MKSFLTALFLLALTVCSTNGLAQDLKKQDSKDAQAEVRTTFEKGDFQKTVKLATTALESNPQLSVLLWYRGLSHQKLGEYDAAVQDYQAYLGSAKDKARILNAIAWIHAARPEIPKRQPKTAIELASQACELTGYKDGFNMDTLATAYAADSQFDLAAMIQEKAIEAGLNAHGTAYDRLDDMKAHRVIKDGLAAHKANNPTVIFHNLTSQRLSLRVVKTIDSDGTPTRRDWNYTVMPH
ncbi:MAG: hypothetical protein KDA91_18645 [Planctomycetaceae bacterium]|nr:hypothetical protein [Planctomycetaceae bacterium]